MSLLCCNVCVYGCVHEGVEEELLESSKLYCPCVTRFIFILRWGKKKDTASKLQFESPQPGFSARGQKPSRMVDMGSHDAQSAGQSRIYIRPPVS